MQQATQPATSFASILASMAPPPRTDADIYTDGLAEDVVRWSQKSQTKLAEKPDAKPDVAVPSATEIPAADKKAAPIFTRSRKSASITIRLSPAENLQLRQRAADAGMTVSSYLRSCTLEAESLRASIKEALAQMRNTQAKERPDQKQNTTTQPRQRWQGKWKHIFA